MKVCKFLLVSVFIFFLVIAILFGAFLTLSGIVLFFEELKLINETLALSFVLSLFGLVITMISVFIFKKFILED